MHKDFVCSLKLFATIAVLLRAKKFLKFSLLSCAFLGVPRFAQATTYYVDATAGSDSNAGTTTSSSWQTIAKVTAKDTSSAAPFKPGDVILFKQGEVWRESLRITSSGTAGNPIVIGSYGTGSAKPIISGADIVNPSLWKEYGGNIYVADVGKITVPNQLYVDGVFYEIARYPIDSYLISTAKSPTNATVIDVGLNLPTNEIAGSTLVVRPNSWSSQAVQVAAYDVGTGTITTSQDLSSGLVGEDGFYLRNQLWMLTSAKRWFYDSSAGKLYVRTVSGDSPASHVVEISDRNNGIAIAGSGYVTVENIEETYGQIGVSSSNTTVGVIFDNLTVNGGVTGISLSTCASCNGIVKNSQITGAVRYGVVVNGGTGILVQNNVILNAGNMLIQPDGGLASLMIKATASTVSNNTISYSGYVGIDFNGANVSIINNNVNYSCLKLDDCGGIYTSAASAYDAEVGDIVSGNVINNSIGNFKGTIYNYTKAMGIYLDDLRHDITVTNNFVSNTDRGIFIHNGYNDVVTGNRFLASRQDGIRISEDKIAGYTRNNTVMGNVFGTYIGTNSNQNAAATFGNNLTASINFGSFNHNIYCHPNMIAVVYQQTRIGNGVDSFGQNLAAWQKMSGQDLQSTDTRGPCNAAPPKY